jgi:hypothetical protein
MKLLMENWREFISESNGMKTVDDLVNFVDEEFPEYQTDIYVLISHGEYGGVEFSYAAKDEDGVLYELGYNDAIKGKVHITPMGPDDLAACAGAYQVKWASATKGWGPLLYDIAIEYATIHGNGLISDREEVSDKARPVWNYYLNKRGDVESHQLDDTHNTLTPEEEDNCDQYIASLGGKYDWQENALSKRYTKEPTTMVGLEKLGRLINKT